MQKPMHTLKSTIDINFLLNNFKMLAELMEDDLDFSKAFLQKLVSVYHYLLCMQSVKTISVADEIAFISDYVYLNKIRFGRNIRLNIPSPDQFDGCSITPLTMLMLVENAIKYNLVHERNDLDVLNYAYDGAVIEEWSTGQRPFQLTITVRFEYPYIVIENNLNPSLTQVKDGTTSLRNVIATYLQSTATLSVIEITGNYFRVKIPLL